MGNKLGGIAEKYHRFKEWQEKGCHAETLAVEEAEKSVCSNCKTVFRGNYCPGCGQPVVTDRFDLKETSKTLIGAFYSFDSGLKHTFVELAGRPGYMIRDYLGGHRAEYVKPIRLLFLTTTILLLIQTYVPNIKPTPLHEFIAERVSEFDDYPVVFAVLNFLNDIMGNYAYHTLFNSLVCVLPMWFVFRSTRIGKVTNLYETFYMLVYMSCSCVLFGILSLPLQFIYNLWTDDEGFSLMLPFYFNIPLEAWIIHQFYSLGYLKSLWKNILFYILLTVSLFLIIAIPCIVFIAVQDL